MDVSVLAVDDSRVTQMIIRKHLNSLGIEKVTVVEGGRDALRVFQQHHFDLVIADWNMPDGSGIELALGIRATGSEVPIIMVTSESDRLRVKSAILAGVTDYLLKPVDQETFHEKITRHLTRVANEGSTQ